MWDVESVEMVLSREQSDYKKMPMQYTEIFKAAKKKKKKKKKDHQNIFDIFLVFAQNIDYGYTLEEAVLTSTHNLCFGSKIRKKCIPLYTPVLLHKKSGVQGIIHFTDMLS